MLTAGSGQELLPVSVALVPSLMLCFEPLLFIRGIQILINRCQVVPRRLNPLVPHVALMHLYCQFLYIIDIQIGYRLLALALCKLSQARDPNQESGLAHSFLMLLREEFKEVTNCN